jgi:hypothetical protein
MADGDVVKSERLSENLARQFAAWEKLTEHEREDFARKHQETGGEMVTRALWDGLKGALGQKGQVMDDYLAKNPRAGPRDIWLEFAKVARQDEERRLRAEIARLGDVVERMKAIDRSDKGPNLAQSYSGGGGDSIDSYEEASRRYNLPLGHPQKLSHEDFKDQRLRFGIR